MKIFPRWMVIAAIVGALVGLSFSAGMRAQLIAPAQAARIGNFVAPEPYRAYAAVTKSDATTYGIPGATNPKPIEALYIGGTGDVALVGQDQATAVTLSGVPVGTILLVSPYKIMSTNTTATNIVALYR